MWPDLDLKSTSSYLFNNFCHEEFNPQDHFTPDELQNLREIFSMFDHDDQGSIALKDLRDLFSHIDKNPEDAQEYVARLGFEEHELISFQQFLHLLHVIESEIDQNRPGNGDPSARHEINAETDQNRPIEPDTKVVDFLKLLEEYRRKCEREGNYAEAKRARKKYEDLKKKECNRQANNIRSAQQQELHAIQEAQRSQFVEFSRAWDNYMSDYEATAYMSLEKLKERHLIEFQQFQDKVKKEVRSKMKYSEDLLVRMKKYELAEQVKAQADALEEWENAKLEAEMKETMDKKVVKFKHQQQLELSALLKRIQRDRNEQLKHRQLDSQRLIQRNKNICNDILAKQNQEVKKTVSSIKQVLSMVGSDSIFVPRNAPQRSHRAQSTNVSARRTTGLNSNSFTKAAKKRESIRSAGPRKLKSRAKSTRGV
eukprot:CAMPEP_0115023004 /NCGR_PEP_ID=MMETSP0216-20121206/32036_1 /TAXON_ID=223996 /ORGANISM="Protocruzia adherens, Strain Boccale" /LENGTH=425 /DNA_ID=CAMNT_0002396093 /DNA_START=60 /DNA_END=1337 /DNA_ORIENTATION=+